jgi:hypothetical protein
MEGHWELGVRALGTALELESENQVGSSSNALTLSKPINWLKLAIGITHFHPAQ